MKKVIILFCLIEVLTLSSVGAEGTPGMKYTDTAVMQLPGVTTLHHGIQMFLFKEVFI